MTWTARAQKKCCLCNKRFWPTSSAQRICGEQKCRDHRRTQDGRRKLGVGYTPKLPMKRKCIACGKFFEKAFHVRHNRWGRTTSFVNYTCAKLCAVCRPKHTRKVLDKNQRLRRERERASGKVQELRLRDDGIWVDGYGNRHEKKRCRQCGKMAMMRLKAEVCSRKCRDVARRASPEEKAAWGSRQKRCEACNKLFWARLTKFGQAKFCSQQCFGADYRARDYKTPEQSREEKRLSLRKYRSIPTNKERKNELMRGYRTVEYQMQRPNKGEREWLRISQLELTRVRNLLAGKAGEVAATKAGRNEPPPRRRRASPSPKPASTPHNNSRA